MDARGKIREFFIANVGKVLSTQKIRKIGGLSEYARRIRELRAEEDCRIKSHVDRADLKPGEHILETLEQKPVISRTSSPQLRNEILERNGFTCRFCDEGKLAAHFGIVPRVSNSNKTERSGRITKQGCKPARTALAQCALIAARYSSCLQTCCRRIAAARGTGKAIIALAGKFLGIIYKTLKNNWIFEGCTRFVRVNG